MGLIYSNTAMTFSKHKNSSNEVKKSAKLKTCIKLEKIQPHMETVFAWK
jgi:hypothetical protein